MINYNINKKNTVIFLFSLFFACIVSFQLFGYSNDYNLYKQMLLSDDFNVEPIWFLLKSVNKIFFSQIYLLIFVTSFFSMYVKFSILKESLSDYYFIAIICYFFSIFWLHEYTQFRASLAISMFCLLIKPNQRKSKIFLICLLCTLFHYSCLVLFPLIFYLNFKKKVCYILFPTVLLLFSLFISTILRDSNFLLLILSNFSDNPFIKILISKLGHNSSEFSVLNLLYLFLFFLLFLSYFFGIREKKCVDNYYYLCFKLSSYSLCLFYIFSLTPFPVVAFRTSEFFLFFYIVLLIKNLTYIKEKFFYAVFVFVYVILLSVKMLTSTGRL